MRHAPVRISLSLYDPENLTDEDKKELTKEFQSRAFAYANDTYVMPRSGEIMIIRASKFMYDLRIRRVIHSLIDFTTTIECEVNNKYEYLT